MMEQEKHIFDIRMYIKSVSGLEFFFKAAYHQCQP